MADDKEKEKMKDTPKGEGAKEGNVEKKVKDTPKGEGVKEQVNRQSGGKPEGGKRPEGQERRGSRRPEEKAAGQVNFSMSWPARVEEVVGRTGTRGEAIQVRAKVLDGRDQNKVLRRNVKGPIKPGDILMLRETEIEARKLTQRRK